jgi:hypothetical protein
MVWLPAAMTSAILLLRAHFILSVLSCSASTSATITQTLCKLQVACLMFYLTAARWKKHFAGPALFHICIELLTFHSLAIIWLTYCALGNLGNVLQDAGELQLAQPLLKFSFDRKCAV